MVHFAVTYRYSKHVSSLAGSMMRPRAGSPMRPPAHRRKTVPGPRELAAAVLVCCLHSVEPGLPSLAFSNGGVLYLRSGRSGLGQRNLLRPSLAPLDGRALCKTRLRSSAPIRNAVHLRMAEDASDALDVCGDGGCLKVILEKGIGEDTPQAGDTVQLEYFINVNGQLIDSSEGIFEFDLGMEPSDAIKGWEKAIPTMKEKETAVVTCAPNYAFGEQGAPPKIPPNATLECELKLISWVNKGKEREKLADAYTPTDAPEEQVYDDYKKSIEKPENTETTAQDLDVNTTNPKPPEIFKLDDPRIRKMTSRNQRVEGKAKGYRWHETEQMIDIYVAIPAGTKAKSIQCDIGGQSLYVALKGGETLAEGKLGGSVYASESVWGITGDEKEFAVHISLRKKPSDQRIWATVFEMSGPLTDA